MFDREATAEEQDRILGELAELGLAFARALTARVEAVQSTAEADALALAFHRATRSARLAIALQAKLARERHDLVRMDKRLAEQRADARKKQIRTVLYNEIYTEEAEQEASDTLFERLKERLDDDALFDAFLEGPVEAAIARIRQDLGLAANDAGPSSPAPAEAPPDAAVPPRPSLVRDDPARVAEPSEPALRLAARGPP